MTTAAQYERCTGCCIQNAVMTGRTADCRVAVLALSVANSAFVVRRMCAWLPCITAISCTATPNSSGDTQQAQILHQMGCGCSQLCNFDNEHKDADCSTELRWQQVLAMRTCSDCEPSWTLLYLQHAILV